jgi:hypothetical protein
MRLELCSRSNARIPTANGAPLKVSGRSRTVFSRFAFGICRRKCGARSSPCCPSLRRCPARSGTSGRDRPRIRTGSDCFGFKRNTAVSHSLPCHGHAQYEDSMSIYLINKQTNARLSVSCPPSQVQTKSLASFDLIHFLSALHESKSPPVMVDGGSAAAGAL